MADDAVAGDGNGRMHEPARIPRAPAVPPVPAATGTTLPAPPAVAAAAVIALFAVTPALGAAAADSAAPAPAQLVLTGLTALVFAAIHMLGRAMRFLRTTPRSVWLSAAGGVSVAYVFVHILPELDHHQDMINEMRGFLGFLNASERHVYYVALLGLAAFYGLESSTRWSARRRAERGGARRPSICAFWLHLAAYAVFNVVIGYLLLDREETDLPSLLTYAVAMAMHFIVADQGLRQLLYPAYDAVGRWILAAAPILGWVLGVAIDVPPLAVSALFAFLAGGIMLTVLKEELPEHHRSHFTAFALATGLYATLLIAVD
jgi:hypothetical protein